MMKLFKIIGGILAGFILIIVIFFAYYVFNFWPRYAEDKVVGQPDYAHKVLIATQGSDYKEAVVDRVIEKLNTDTVFVMVTDVSNLENVSPDNWTNIIILNTSIANKLNSDVRDFLNRIGPSDKIMVVTTSGGGDFIPPNLEVDGITTASKLNEIEAMAIRIFQSM